MTKEEFQTAVAKLMGEAMVADVISGFVLIWRDQANHSGGYMANTTDKLEVARRLQSTIKSLEEDGNVTNHGVYLVDEDGSMAPVRLTPGEEPN